MKKRLEKDFLGTVEIPEEVYYGVNTTRALHNFPISGLKNHEELIRAITEIKLSACLLFRDLKKIDKRCADAIIKACEELINGKLIDQIVVDVFQAGAGTSLNMNINEVIANRANEILGFPKGTYKPIHPNDTVNMAQSTNDVIPTAMRISTIRMALRLIEKTDKLAKTFLKKGKEFKNLIKSGRTHLMDATPITLGDEFTAYGNAIKKDSKFIKMLLEPLYIIGLGGTATGSGVNAPKEYQENITTYLKKTTGIPLKRNPDLFEAMQNQSDFARFMGGIKSLTLNLIRITNDLRLLSSGPNTGLNEIRLPEVQAGSSIMPGKVNPSILEMTTMVCFFVIGMEQTVSFSVQAGQLELNVMMPIIANSVLWSLEYLTNAIEILDNKCISGIKANNEILKKYARSSLALATILSPHIGYEKTAEIVKLAKKTGKPILDIIDEQKILTKKDFENLLKINK
ncbi:MAG: aspartate ammonia-lyase [Proteobacteria bacterium]|nr:aspartate ammonia-lyase [Pseudomonadota bacterium]